MLHACFMIWLAGMLFNTFLATYGVVVRAEKMAVPLKYILGIYGGAPFLIFLEVAVIVFWPLFYVYLVYRTYTNVISDYSDGY